jgi:hypothetical protein
MDMSSPDASKFEIGVITKDSEGRIVQKRIEGAELNKILEDAKVAEIKK